MTLQDEPINILNSLEELLGSISCKMELEEIEMEYLRYIAPIIPAHATALYLFKPGKSNPIRIAGKGVNEEFLTYYETRGRELDPLRGWITKNRSPYQSQLLLGLEGWKHHPVYQVVGTMGIDFAMQAPIVSGGEIIGTLNFGREVHEGAFTKIDLSAVSVVSNFLHMAISNALGRKELRQYQEKIFLSLDHVRQGVVITDSDCTVRYANQTARRLARRILDSESPAKQLSSLINEERQQRHTGTMKNKKLPGSFCPLPGSHLKQTLVLLNEPSSSLSQSSFGSLLTRREFEVLQLVECGLHNQEIAERLFVSVNTIKRHLDNLYAKFNVNSRTELVTKAYQMTHSPHKN